ncbi:MAG: electron transfer flavoprotein-ubiquinone oxidoreductase [Acidobacteriota bacterium]|nr:electron transfer flavoprotein-ubiquinone oxidoreductase [Blastocatellia bacterium]MDW8411319.1 electron transfer flavoprotein-ubiquinone oxidoreductase [Acidobacteriota bacterium]
MGKQRESLELDVLFVGAGPACLAGAIHLKRLINKHNESATDRKLEDLTIGIIEKGREVGAHILSGAVMDPRALKELFPDFLKDGAPVEAEVTYDKLLYLTEEAKLVLPFTPPPLVNHGNYVVSLSKMTRWLATKAEELGVDIFPEFPAAEPLYEGNRVVGVRTSDRGIGKDGKPKGNYEPGVDIFAKVTVVGEGCHGSLTKKLRRQLKLDEGRNPQVYAIGVKEIWELPKGRVKPGHVFHTVGYPLDSNTYGGGWIYHMKDDLLDIGLVVGLDYKDPLLDPHHELQRLKLHPYLQELLNGGKLVAYGAKTIPEGGLYSMPKLYADGLLLVGDSAGFLNSMRLKGIHLAMKSGMMAAEAIFQALLDKDYGAAKLKLYDDLFRSSWAYQELYSARNFHQAFHQGMLAAMINAGLQFVTGGKYWGLIERASNGAGHERMQRLVDYYGTRYAVPNRIDFDGKLTFDKLTDVYYSSTNHDEDQPSHLKILEPNICIDRCTKEYGNPCQYFCPAKVYEIQEEHGKPKLHINFSNCVHCKTCDIMDPYQIIEWVTPEGGGGPGYVIM